MRRSEFIDIALNLIANTFKTATTANDGIVGTVVGTVVDLHQFFAYFFLGGSGVIVAYFRYRP